MTWPVSRQPSHPVPALNLASTTNGASSCRMATTAGLNAVQMQSYGSEARGGECQAEVIVSDDCSTDGTYQQLFMYVNYKDPNLDIKLMKNPTNVGTYVSLNRALQQCSGDYITRIDSDDKFHPNKLQKQVSFLDTHLHLDGVYHKVVRDSRPIVSEVSLMYKKSIVQKIGYYDSVRFAADTEFKDRLNKVCQLGNINQVLYYAKNRPNSLITSKITGYGPIRNRYARDYIKWHQTTDINSHHPPATTRYHKIPHDTT